MINPEDFIAGLRQAHAAFTSQPRQPAQLDRTERAAYEPLDSLECFDMGQSETQTERAERKGRNSVGKWG